MKKNCIYIILLMSFLSFGMIACDEEGEKTESTVSEIEKISDEETSADQEDYNTEISEDVEVDVDESEKTDAVDTYPVGQGANISFDTVDLYGNRVNQDILQDATIVMLNLWEPWCGPCVGEMPDLNDLYETYKDDGLLIIGAYTTFDMDKEAQELVEELGISYPIIKCNESISSIEQDYVPATFILDRDGNLITEEPFAGSNSYEGWEEIIKEYLK